MRVILMSLPSIDSDASDGGAEEDNNRDLYFKISCEEDNVSLLVVRGNSSENMGFQRMI
jgi:hypothetical protein